MIRCLVIAVFAVFASAFEVAGAQTGTTTTVLVRSAGGDAAVSDHLRVEYSGKEAAVQSVSKIGTADGAPLELAILIDEGDLAVLRKQQDDLKRFASAVAGPRIAVGVGYMRHGTVSFPAGFTTSPESASKAMELPAVSVARGDPVASVAWLAKIWPRHAGAARVVLLLSSGLDFDNPAAFRDRVRMREIAQDAVGDAQRAGISIYSVDCNPQTSGLEFLEVLSDGTGGEVLDGVGSWTSIAPMLKTFQQYIGSTYQVTFAGGDTVLHKLKVITSLPGVKVKAQTQAMANR